MFDNLVLLAAVIIVAWLGVFIYYMVTSEQQRHLQDDIDEVDRLLGDAPAPSDEDAGEENT